MKSKINWSLDQIHTWNITSGCTKVSAGCAHCYAERLVSTRLRHLPQNGGVVRGDKNGIGHWTGLVRCHDDKLSEPLRRKTPTTYFVCSQSDLFHEAVPFEFFYRALAVMALCPQHTFMILTKRPERMMECYDSFNFDWDGLFAKLAISGISIGSMNNALDTQFDIIQTKVDETYLKIKQWPLDNVWLGTSVENQKAADERIPPLLDCPASKRFLSCEPLLGKVDLRNIAPDLSGQSINALTGLIGHSGFALKGHIDLVIVGGESGPNARPMHPDWARSLRDQCKDAGVPFFFKQWGEWAPMSSIVERRAVVMKALETQHSLGTDGSFTRKHRPDCCSMYKVGKKAAGCLLDGVEHKEWPE